MFVVVLILLAMFFSLSSNAYAKDKIVIGAARPLSGPLAFFEENAFGAIYKMWVDEVNARGGIYVKEYGKKLPIEMLVYDDKSDMGTMTRLLDKLILQDKVDFVFPPASTAFLFAAGAIANRHKKILIGAEGGLSTVAGDMSGMPYFFGILNFADHYQMPALAEIYKELGVKTASIIFIDDLHGIEYSAAAEKEFKANGIKILMKKGVPADIKDVSPLIKEAKSINADAFLAFTYPWITFPVVGTSQALNFNPKSMVLGPGGGYEVAKNAVGGADVLEGIMWEGAWSIKSSPGHKVLFDKLVKRYGRQVLDWWGHNLYWAMLELFEQAIEKAGTLDNTKIKDILHKEKFETLLGTTYFKNQLLARECFSGQVGQWQNGETEVIDVGPKRTAKPIYPKPPWPAPKPKK
jgi:branched-chain amino acid transport system substrate-binding protein